ncbi:relaxase/mobilization nuclease domain-containing protein [Vibrio cholerae]|uniref:relaxase/mobilization nuclease domain-containing protein n=1 Tax=Vibrio cholerae TaxID=666 RepID=UPI0011599E2D|nr:relaxase/mobilization nuclease domain-containing protein [Vibrio cholerae]TQP63450.1 hypothetical protein FLL95_01365 [Vibrio cholerae]
MSLEEFNNIKVKQGRHKGVRVNLNVAKPQAKLAENKKESVANTTLKSEAVFKVVSHIKKGSMAVINYIAKDHHEEQKNEIDDVEQNTAADRLSNYVSREGKILMQHSSGADMDEKDMKKLMSDWNKQFQEDDRKNARTMTHIILSSDKCKNPEEFKRIVSDTLARTMPENYEYVFAIHTDTNNLHAHLVINNYGLDGKKLHIDKNWCNEKRLAFAETLNEYGYAHKATLKHHRDLDKSLKQEIAETETYVKDYFAAKVKTKHPENYQAILHLRKVYEETGSIQDLRQLRKEIELGQLNTTQSKIKLNKSISDVKSLGLKLTVERKIRNENKTEVSKRIERLERKQVASVTDMLMYEKKLIDKGELTDGRYQTIQAIKEKLSPKVLDQAEDNLRRRQDPVFSKLDRECVKYLRGIQKNDIDPTKHDERLFKIIELERKIKNNAQNLTPGHKKLIDERLNKVISAYEKAGINFDAARQMHDKQKQLTIEIRMLRYSEHNTEQLKEKFADLHKKIPETALTEKDRVRLEMALRKEILNKNSGLESVVLDAEKAIRQSNKAIQTTLSRDSSPYSLAVNGLKLNEAEHQIQNQGIKTSRIESVINQAYEQLEKAGMSKETIQRHVLLTKEVEQAKQGADIKTFSDLLHRADVESITVKHGRDLRNELREHLKAQHPVVSESIESLEKKIFTLAKANDTLSQDAEKRPLIERNAIELRKAIDRASDLPIKPTKALEAAQKAIDKTLSPQFDRKTIESRFQASKEVEQAVKNPSKEMLSNLWEKCQNLPIHDQRHMKTEIFKMMKQTMPEAYKEYSQIEKAINHASASISTLTKKSGDQSQWLTQNGLKIVEASEKLKELGLDNTDAYQKAQRSIESLNQHGIESSKLLAVQKIKLQVEKLNQSITDLLSSGDVHKVNAKIQAIETDMKKHGVKLPKETYQQLKDIKTLTGAKAQELKVQHDELSKKLKPITPSMTNLERVQAKKHNKPYIEQQQRIEQKLTGKEPKREQSIKR